MIELTHRWTKSILFKIKAGSVRLAIETALKSGADLRGANLRDVKNAALALARTSIVPESGTFDGWKLCRSGVLVHLRIPADAARSNATGRKCRAAYVDVLEVIGGDEGVSLYDGITCYRAGERITCQAWDPDRLNECSGGIHFYLTRIEAEYHA